MGSGLWGGMNSFKPGWLCGMMLDVTMLFQCPGLAILVYWIYEELDLV